MDNYPDWFKQILKNWEKLDKEYAQGCLHRSRRGLGTHHKNLRGMGGTV